MQAGRQAGSQPFHPKLESLARLDDERVRSTYGLRRTGDEHPVLACCTPWQTDTPPLNYDRRDPFRRTLVLHGWLHLARHCQRMINHTSSHRN